MKKAMLIVNPTSGGEKALDYKDKLKKKLETYFDEVEICITEKQYDATDFAARAAKNKYDSVFAFGGDGTVNEVISGIAEKDHIPKLGIIPGGTGNLMAKLVGVNPDIDSAIEELDFFKTEFVDIGKYNNNYFGYILSIGSVSEAIHNVGIEEKTKFGVFAYVASVIKSVIGDETFPIHIKTETKEYNGQAGQVSIMLSNLFGDAKIFDEDKNGYANILILKDSSFVSKLSLLPDIINGSLTENDEVHYIRARNIEISSPDDLETDVDGDKGDKLPIKINVLGQHIEVYSNND